MRSQLFGIFALFTTFMSFVEQTIPFFVISRSLYEVRERPSKTYSWKAFMFANILVELPWNLVGDSLFPRTSLTGRALADRYFYVSLLVVSYRTLQQHIRHWHDRLSRDPRLSLCLLLHASRQHLFRLHDRRHYLSRNSIQFGQRPWLYHAALLRHSGLTYFHARLLEVHVPLQSIYVHRRRATGLRPLESSS